MASTARSLAGTTGNNASLPPHGAATLLADLRHAHQDLLAAIATLEELTAQPHADISLYPGARWRLSLASRKRRTLVAAASAALLPAVSQREAEAIEMLRREATEQLRQSGAHVRAWPTERIAADWMGYRAASALIRGAMRRRIEAERAALCPPLERLARRG